MFKNKKEALYKLIEVIDKNIISHCVVLALNKDAIFYAKEIALANGMLEGDFLFVEEIPSPVNEETYIAAISETKDFVIVEELVDSFNITDDYLFSEIDRVYKEKILKDIYQFRKGESIIPLENRDVLLVDEGANSGLRLLCAIKSCLNQKVNSINVALPLIAKDTAEMIEKIVDNTFFGKVIEDYVDTRFYFKEYEE